MHRPVLDSTRARARGVALAVTVAALCGVLSTGGPTWMEREAVRAEHARYLAMVQRVAVQEDLVVADAAWGDGRRTRAAVQAGDAARTRMAAELAALGGRLDAVVTAVTGAPVQAGDEALITAATDAAGVARTAVTARSLTSARPLVVQAEQAAAAVAVSVQARAAAEEAARRAAEEAARQAAEQAAQEAARQAAQRSAGHRGTGSTTARSAGTAVAAPAAQGGGSAWDEVRSAAAGVAGRYGVSVAWVTTTGCGQSGYVSAGRVSLRGCSMPHSGSIQLSFGGQDPGAFGGSRSRLLALVRAVTAHECAHRQIEHLTGSLFPVARSEQVADAYAATYLGMPASLASYGFTGADVATAQAIHDGRW